MITHTTARSLLAAAALLSITSIATAQSVALSGASTRGPVAAPARTYGDAVKVGDGTARTYVELDRVTGAPTEIGVALSERALEALPTAGAGHHGMNMVTHEFILSLPVNNKTPFTFVEMNWNPKGHEPEGVYQDVPHFDFHFYVIPKAARDAIMPTDTAFERKADNLPSKEFIPPFVAPLGPPGAPPSKLAVPMMGVHWSDLRSPELQKLLGKPDAFKPFTATFIHGTWDGQIHFWEPMITLAHLLEKKATADEAVRDQLIPLPIPAKYQQPGYYPTSYRITWDAATREYRVALSQLEKR
jgi:hypothetical protein